MLSEFHFVLFERVFILKGIMSYTHVLSPSYERKKLQICVQWNQFYVVNYNIRVNLPIIKLKDNYIYLGYLIDFY